MKRILLFLSFVLFAGNAWSYTISRNAEISLITAEPGDQLYSVFGHSAIWIKDSVRQIDKVYNYGTFDFNTPYFYVKFARGRLKYMIAVESFESFFPEYYYGNRTLYEQKLNLTYAEKKSICDFLQWNMKPENRYYSYDFFYDNCATRIRDVIQDQINKQIHWDTTKMAQHSDSFRDLISDYLESQPWNELGIDLALGLPADKKAKPRQYMFLPEWLKEGFEDATIGKNRPLIKQSDILFQGDTKEPGNSPLLPPALILWLVFGLGLFSMYIKRFEGLYDRTIFFVAGFIGIIEILLWFATDHTTTHMNMNLLWALPTHFLAAFWMGRVHRSSLLRIYFFISFLIGLFVLIFWYFLPQDLNEALIPLVLILVIKSFRLSWTFLPQWIRLRKVTNTN